MANDGTIVGSPVFSARTGFGQSCGSFTDADYISLPGTPFDNTFGAGASWTINLWIRTTYNASSDCAFLVSKAGGVNPRIGNFTGLLQFVFSTGSTGFPASKLSTTRIDNGAWRHIRLTCNVGLDIYCFIDGIQEWHVTGVWGACSGCVPKIGRQSNTGFAWHGDIDEVEIRAEYMGSSNFTPPAAPVSGIGSTVLYHLDGSAADSAILRYDTVDAVGPNYGQAIRVYVPNAAAAIPYAGAPTDLIIYCHSGAADRTEPGTNLRIAGFMDAALGTDGYILVASDAHGTNTYGVQASLDDYLDAYVYCINHYNIRNVFLLGASMGGLTGLDVLLQKKVPIRGMIGAYPVTSLAAQYALGGIWVTVINAAYGIGGAHTYADTTKGMDPLLHAATDFGGIPIMLVCSPADGSVNENTNSLALKALVAGITVYEATGSHASADHWDVVTAHYHDFFANPHTTNVRVYQSGADAILEWDTDVNALHYLIWRSPTGLLGSFTPIATVDAPTTTYTDTTVQNLSDYYVVTPTPF